MRRIIGQYGKRFILRGSYNVAILALVYFVSFLIIILAALKLVNNSYDGMTIWILSFDTAVFMLLLLRMLVGSAYLNSQFQTHKEILKSNQVIFNDFHRMAPLFVGKRPIIPDNTVYREGLRMLKEELGEENFDKKLIERSKLLVNISRDMINNLDFAETYHPNKVLGVPINYGILKTIMVGIVSLGFTIYQRSVS